MDRRGNEKNVTSREHLRTSQVLGRGRLLLNYLRQPATTAPGPSGEYPLSNVFFVDAVGRQNRLVGLVPIRRTSWTVMLEPILSAGSLEDLSPINSNESVASSTYQDAQSNWSLVDFAVVPTETDLTCWWSHTARWLHQYGGYMVLGVAGICALGYTIAKTYQCDLQPSSMQ